ncbi:MAG TPA: SMI1/KNR4 family protein, partial [Candidatus Obscuribacterales bacterium]
FQLGPPLALSEIDAFEARNGLILPTDFRLFVTQVGNGGPGPAFHGLLPFEPNHTGYTEANWNEPFVHPTEVRQLAETRIRARGAEDMKALGLDPAGYEHWLEEQGLWIGEAIDELAEELSEAGYIEVGDHGCGIFDFLVVKGQEYGHIWWSDDQCRKLPALDTQASDAVLKTPGDWDAWRARLLAPEYVFRQTFLEYYGNYLRSVLKQTS